MNEAREVEDQSVAEERADPDLPHQPTEDRRRIGRATAVVAAFTALSRVGGLLREIVTAAYFGVSATMSAFTVAWQLPQVIRHFLSDVPLTSALVPVFSRLREDDERERAWRVVSTVLTVMVVVMAPLTVTGVWFAPALVGLLTQSGFEPTELTAELLRMTIPTIILFAVFGWVVAVLHSFGRFTAAALAPAIWNLAVIGALLLVVPFVPNDLRVHAYALSVLIATAVQVMIPLPWLRRVVDGSIRPSLAIRDPAVRQILVAFVPITVALALLNVNQLVNTFLASGIVAGDATGPAVIDKARRVYMLPQGVFTLAVSAVFFPALARYRARLDWRSFGRTATAGVHQLFMVLLPATAVLVALQQPIVRVLFQRGEFSSSDTAVVADVLAASALGLAFHGAALVLMRVSFSLEETAVPLRAGILIGVANAGLAYMLQIPYGLVGIALGASAAFALGFVYLLASLARSGHGIEFWATLSLIVRGSVLAVAAAFLARGLFALAAELLPATSLWIGFGLALTVGMTAAAYILAATRMRILSSEVVAVLTGGRIGKARRRRS